MAALFFDQLHSRGSPWGSGRQDNWRLFREKIERWQKKPYPLHELHRELDPLFTSDPDLLGGLDQYMIERFPKQIAKAEEAYTAQQKKHREACEVQSESRLLTLPREIRDKIWAEAVTGQVIHISRGEEHTSKRRCAGRPRRIKFFYHACKAGLQSSACPAGQGDHSNCSTDGPSSYYGISLVCRQISMELPKRDQMLARNALQFSDLDTADKFLFGLKEDVRASVTHLKLAVPSTVPQDLDYGEYESWEAICNYYSNPWDRETLNMYPQPGDHPSLLRAPIYFYYSECYYNNNRDRLYKRCQVGRGDTSWDIGISDLKYNGCPRLDIAMSYPNVDYGYRFDLQAQIWDTSFDDCPPEWIKPLLQFRNYDRLKFEFYDKDGVKDHKKAFVAALKEYMAGPPIGPQICAFFAGQSYENGNQGYQFW